MSKIKDRFRANTVGAEKKFRSQDLTLQFADGPCAVRLRSPTVEERSQIISSSGVVDPKTGDVKPDLAKLQTNSVIALTVDPETGEKMFDEADRESMLKSPAGGWFDELSRVSAQMLNVDLDDAKNG